MYQIDYDEFKQVLKDLCISVNRPFNDDLMRVFWADLRRVSLADVKRQAEFVRSQGNRKFSAADLKPAVGHVPKFKGVEGDGSDDFQRIAGITLLRFIYVNDVPNEALREMESRSRELVEDARRDPDLRGLDFKSLKHQLVPIFQGMFERMFIDMVPAQKSPTQGDEGSFQRIA